MTTNSAPNDTAYMLLSSILVGLATLVVVAWVLGIPMRARPEQPEPRNVAVRWARNPEVRALVMSPRVEVKLVPERTTR